MPFQPPFSEAGESEIIDNLFAAIDTNMKPGLDHFYPTDDLPDFALKTLGEFNIFNCPLLVIMPDRMRSRMTNEGFHLGQDLSIGLGLSLKDAKPDVATRKAMKYVRVLKQVIRLADDSNLILDKDSTLDHVIDFDHDYLRRKKDEAGQWVQPVQMIMKVTFGET